MTDTTSKKRKNTYKVLFFLSFIGLVGLGILFVNLKMNKTTASNEVELMQIQLDSINQNNQTLLDILAADDLLISQTNSKKALEQYQAIFKTANEQLQSSVVKRIEYAKQVVASEKDDEITKINLRSQLANQQKLIDSLSEFSEDIAKSKEEKTALQASQLEDLEQKVAKLKNELARKDSKQVISFTNQNGNLIHYLGEVKDGKANGGGIGIWNTGSIYKGEWKNNMRHGVGEFKWADGQVYVGEFENDIRSGEGTYSWPSGEKYVGEFENNRMNGQGILYDPDGNKKYEGKWKNDKPDQ
jgi:hypothetical protein